MTKINGPFFAVTFTTESGDSGLAGVFNEEPTQGQLRALALEDYPDEVIQEEDDEGNTVTTLYIFFTVHEIESILDLPDPVDEDV